MNAVYQDNRGNKLIFLGILLFLIGLITGLFVPILANPRFGLSSHIEGVMNGMLLVLIGIIWPRLKLDGRGLNFTYGLLLYGTFANWAVMLIAAIFNAGKMLTIASTGQEGSPLIEGVITFLLISLSLAMITASGFLLRGLYPNLKQNNS